MKKNTSSPPPIIANLPARQIREKRISFRLDATRYAAIQSVVGMSQTTITQVMTTAVDHLIAMIDYDEQTKTQTAKTKNKRRY